jgi:hypothetical protein
MICESGDNQHREGHSFIMSVNEIAVRSAPWTI